MFTIEQGDPRMRLLKQYGSIRKIPDEVLKTEGVRRLHDEEQNADSLITEAEYEKKKGECFGVLKKYDGYIFTSQLDRILRFIKGEEIISDKTLQYCKARGEKFKEANIPPIFNKEFYNPSSFEYPDLFGEENIETKKHERLFPSVDFIIQFATGAYDRKRAAIAASYKQKVGRERKDLPIQPATVQDVKDFRRVAFTSDGKISTLLMRETAAYQKKHFETSNEELQKKYEDMGRMVFLFLEEMLRDMPADEQTYNEWDGNIEVVKQPRWYLSFRPEDRIKIAKAYFDSVEGKPTGKDRDIFALMKVLFPEMAGQAEIEILHRPIQRLFSEAEKTGDYSKIPERVFVEEPWREKYLPKLEQFFTGACKKLLAEDPLAFFTNINNFYTKVPVPRCLPIVPHFQNIFNGFRLEAAKKLNDEQFKELFMSDSGRGRYSGIGTSGKGGGERTDNVIKLREYLKQRYQSLS